MSEMISQKERVVASLLSRFPKLKSNLKYLYYWAYSKKHKVKEKLSLPEGVKSFNFEEEGYEVFFGYYDKSPENKEGSHLLYLKKSLKEEKLFLVVYNLAENKVESEIPVATYNYQQGCKQQWISNDEFIFNDYNFEKQEIVSKIYHVKNQKITKELSHPICETSDQRRFFSINYRRLFKIIPEYGYPYSDQRLDSLSLKEDGIFEVFEDQPTKLLVSIQDICEQLGLPLDGQHRINHLMLAPDKLKIIFLHRFIGSNQVQKDTLILMDLGDLKLTLLSDHDMVSHSFWYDNDTIISYLRRHGEGDHYYKISLNPFSIKMLDQGVFKEISDGHPHVFGDYCVFDTYPQKNRLQNLYCFNKNNECPTLIGRFYSPLKFFAAKRCDLHPRFNFKGSRLYIDSTYTGKRSLLQLEFNSTLTQGLPKS